MYNYIQLGQIIKVFSSEKPIHFHLTAAGTFSILNNICQLLLFKASFEERKKKEGRFSKCAYHSKSEIYSFFSKNVCNTQFWSLVLAIEAMRDELHHLPDDDPGPTPKIKFGMVYLTIVFNMEFIKNLCCLRNSGMLIRHFMLAHLKVCRPFVMRALVKNHGNRHT